MRFMQSGKSGSRPIEIIEWVESMRFECRKCKVVFVGEMTFGDLEEIQKMECGGINGGTHKLVGIGGE